MPRKKTKKEMAAELNSSAAGGQKDTRGADEKPPDCDITWGDEVVQSSTGWLIDGWFPAAGLCLVGGPSDVGKSTMFSALAAHLCGQRAFGWVPARSPGRCLWYTAEENISSKVGPRLTAHGCPLARVGFPCHARNGQMRRRLSLPDDFELLRATILSSRSQLVILDPITSFLGDSVNAMDSVHVRRLVEGLEAAADYAGACILGTLHDRKSKDGPSISHFAGSAAWTQVPRCVVRLGHHPDQDGVRVMVSERCALSQKPKSRICQLWVSGDQVLFTVHEECGIKSDDLEDSPKSVVDREMLREAEDFITSMLKNGDCKSTMLQQTAQQDGLSWMTVRRAKIKLGVTDHKIPGDGTHHTVWRAPAGGFPER